MTPRANFSFLQWGERIVALDRIHAALAWRAEPARPWRFVLRRRSVQRLPLSPTPFGWVRRCVVDATGRRDEYVTGPWWAMLDFFWRDLYCAGCAFALRIGAARAPFDGCYYNELEWWPRR